MQACSLEAVGMTKRLGAFAALDAASKRITICGIHALLGENGTYGSPLVEFIMRFFVKRNAIRRAQDLYQRRYGGKLSRVPTFGIEREGLRRALALGQTRALP